VSTMHARTIHSAPLVAALLALAACLMALAIASAAHAASFSPWQTAVNAESLLGTSPQLNTTSLDGCPIQSPDGLSLYMASTRPRFPGDLRTDLDIWVARRDSVDEPWGAPVNLGGTVNSTADDFCPTPIRGRGLFFVSRKVTSGVTCGAGDIYFTRFNRTHGWSTPEHLDCTTDGGPNTALDEQGPSYVETEAGTFLYFSSGPDIYAARRGEDGGFGPGVAVTKLNSAASDIQPNVRKDGREVVFASNRDATAGQDIWVSTRATAQDPWSAPLNLGSAVNTAANETRPSLSWDGKTLYFGRAPGQESGASDVFVTTRERLP
jgi:WD40-like Beta Propeller Repeat